MRIASLDEKKCKNPALWASYPYINDRRSSFCCHKRFIFRFNDLAAAVIGTPLMVWLGPFCLVVGGLSVSFSLLVMKLSPPFSSLSHRLLDPPHRRGDLVTTTWRWIKGRLAMVVRGREGQMGLGMQQKEWARREMESTLSFCDRVCCGKLTNLFKARSRLLWGQGYQITFNPDGTGQHAPNQGAFTPSFSDH